LDKVRTAAGAASCPVGLLCDQDRRRAVLEEGELEFLEADDVGIAPANVEIGGAALLALSR
jgi:hypothetical protein